MSVINFGLYSIGSFLHPSAFDLTGVEGRTLWAKLRLLYVDSGAAIP